MSNHAVGVVGAGYVGLTTAACVASFGRRVTCVDSDAAKVDALNRAEVTIDEPGLQSLVAQGLADRRLRFTTELPAVAGCSRIFLCLPTPKGDHGGADLRAVESVLAQLTGLLRHGSVLVTKSTVPVGTAERLERAIARSDVRVVSNPEFLREGSAVHDFLHPERIVIGASDPAAADTVAELYDHLQAPVVTTGPSSAELAKYASNAFLAMKVSYANLLAELCERLGADIGDVTRTMGLDSRIGPAFLAPGPGWGGSCLPKDTAALLHTARGAGAECSLVRDTVEVNSRQRSRMVAKVRFAVTGSPTGSLRGVRLGLLGLTFKAGTADLRDSPALAVAEQLAEAGAVLTGYDPAVPPSRTDRVGEVRTVDDPYLVAKGAAGIVLLTEWPHFRELDWAQMAAVAEQPVLVDTRNLLDAQALSDAGIHRVGVGTP